MFYGSTILTETGLFLNNRNFEFRIRDFQLSRSRTPDDATANNDHIELLAASNITFCPWFSEQSTPKNTLM